MSAAEARPTPTALAGQQHHVEDAERRTHPDMLGQEEHGLMAAGIAEPGQIDVIESDRASLRLEQTRDQTEQGRLADPIRPDDGRNLSPPDIRRLDRLEQRKMPIAEAQCVDRQAHRQLSRRTDRIRLRKNGTPTRAVMIPMG